VVVAAGYIAGSFVQVYPPHGGLAGRMMVGGGGAADADIIRALGERARGIISAGPLPADLETPAWTDYANHARRAFPRHPLPTHAFVVPFYVATEAVMRR
jgi:hypothetical protein